MEVTLEGIVMVCRVSQLQKASSPISAMLFPRVTESSFVQPLNSPS